MFNSVYKTITYILRKETPVLLGRWKIDYCQTRIANKVDLSNEDHCGTCSQYIMKRTDLSLLNVKGNNQTQLIENKTKI